MPKLVQQTIARQVQLVELIGRGRSVSITTADTRLQAALLSKWIFSSPDSKLSVDRSPLGAPMARFRLKVLRNSAELAERKKARNHTEAINLPISYLLHSQQRDLPVKLLQDRNVLAHTGIWVPLFFVSP